ncbi:hypothetical protein K737_300410 [Holospora undulata HU1]|uniref:Uncharacterized protein n=2 Tax=Holospora TaxID=44747 RepID=A0A061JGG8_9PROT|nr:hypothetical protein K737_300410 [Holospora undulata HU1]
MNSKKKNIFIIIAILGFSNFGFGLMVPVPQFSTPALCLIADGTVKSLETSTPPTCFTHPFGYACWPGGRFYQLSSGGTFSIPGLAVGNSAYDSIIDTCKNMGGEIDENLMSIIYAKDFGTPGTKVGNSNYIQDLKDKKKGNKFIPVYNNTAGDPKRLFIEGTKKYPVLNLDYNGVMADSELQSFSNLAINHAYSLAVQHMMDKAKKVLDSGTKVDLVNLKKQLDGIAAIRALFEKNTNFFINNLGNVKENAYGKTLDNVAEVFVYTSQNSIGEGKNNTDSTKTEKMLNLCEQSLKDLDSFILEKNKVRSIFENMMNLAKQIPGSEPRDADDMIKNPRKYTIPVFLVSQAFKGNLKMMKLFLEVDVFKNQLLAAKNKLLALKSVKENFFKKLNKKFSELNDTISALVKKKKTFEKVVDDYIVKKKKQDTDGTIKKNFEELQKDIADAAQSYGTLVKSIQEVQSVQDSEFSTALAGQQKRLPPLEKTIQGYIAYKDGMAKMVESAYQKVQDEKNANLAKVVQEVQDHINETNTLLNPIIGLLNNQQSADELWQKNFQRIGVLLNLLSKDKANLDNLSATLGADDVTIKSSIISLNSSVFTEIQAINEVQKRIVLSKIYGTYVEANLLKKRMTADSKDDQKSFNAVWEKYLQDGNTSLVFSEYNDIVLQKNRIKGVLSQSLGILNTMDKSSLDVQNLIKEVGLLLTPVDAETTLDKIFENNVVSKLKGKGLL